MLAKIRCIFYYLIFGKVLNNEIGRKWENLPGETFDFYEEHYLDEYNVDKVYEEFENNSANSMSRKEIDIITGDKIPTLDPKALALVNNLLTKMLNYDFNSRWSTEELLQHPYFSDIYEELNENLFESSIGSIKSINKDKTPDIQNFAKYLKYFLNIYKDSESFDGIYNASVFFNILQLYIRYLNINKNVNENEKLVQRLCIYIGLKLITLTLDSAKYSLLFDEFNLTREELFNEEVKLLGLFELKLKEKTFIDDEHLLNGNKLNKLTNYLSTCKYYNRTLKEIYEEFKSKN